MIKKTMHAKAYIMYPSVNSPGIMESILITPERKPQVNGRSNGAALGSSQLHISKSIHLQQQLRWLQHKNTYYFVTAATDDVSPVWSKCITVSVIESHTAAGITYNKRLQDCWQSIVRIKLCSGICSENAFFQVTISPLISQIMQSKLYK
jgi:hypothetical protein